MAVRRRVFINKISDLIARLLEENPELTFLKTISKGDLSLLPAPEKYPDVMPAVFIDATDVFNEANLGKEVTASAYEFEITYVKYYDKDFGYDIKEKAIEEAELIADTLMEDMDLNNTILPEGRILLTKTPHIGVNSDQNQIFKNLKLPVVVIDINYVVYFRNTKK
jgi:hypothetical protein